MGFRFNVRRSLGAGLIPGGGGAILKPQDVFATSLYNQPAGSSVRVTNGVDLSGRGGLVWEKIRNVADNHNLVDTVRGAGRYLASNTTDAEVAPDGFRGAQAFYNDGYLSSKFNSANPLVGWSFARAAKFFDIITWTGDGTSNRQIPHALGVVPGMVIVKRRDTASTSGWPVYHRSLTAAQYLFLNLTNAAATGGANTIFAAEPTSTTITVGSFADNNASGGTYVAYLFAHDPSADGIVQCGSFTTDASGAATVPLGWKPQFLLFKASSTTGSWFIIDTTRGWAGSNAYLYPNLSNAEGVFSGGSSGATGFNIAASESLSASSNYIYIAIRAPY